MATTYKEKKEKKEKPANIEVKVVSETKRHDRVIKRMVVESWDVSKGKKGSQTFHEFLNKNGGWSRSRGEKMAPKKTTPLKNPYKKGYCPWLPEMPSKGDN